MWLVCTRPSLPALSRQIGRDVCPYVPLGVCRCARCARVPVSIVCGNKAHVSGAAMQSSRAVTVATVATVVSNYSPNSCRVDDLPDCPVADARLLLDGVFIAPGLEQLPHSVALLLRVCFALNATRALARCSSSESDISYHFSGAELWHWVCELGCARKYRTVRSRPIYKSERLA